MLHNCYNINFYDILIVYKISSYVFITVILNVYKLYNAYFISFLCVCVCESESKLKKICLHRLFYDTLPTNVS